MTLGITSKATLILDKNFRYAYNTYMDVEWNPEKARLNLKKHGIRLSDAEAVLFDPLAITEEDRDAEGEQVFASIGSDFIGRILVIVYTYRGNNIRLISARRATRVERQTYEKGI